MADAAIVDCSSGQITVRPLTSAEQAQRDQDAAVASARQQLETTLMANRQSLLAQAAAALQTNRDFLAIASPTNVQVRDQVQALTRQNTALIRLVASLLDATD